MPQLYANVILYKKFYYYKFYILKRILELFLCGYKEYCTYYGLLFVYQKEWNSTMWKRNVKLFIAVRNFFLKGRTG